MPALHATSIDFRQQPRLSQGVDNYRPRGACSYFEGSGCGREPATYLSAGAGYLSARARVEAVDSSTI
jgi:hypothetical protein